MGHGPYVSTKRICKILDDYMDHWGINRTDLARELASATGQSEERWARRLYAWYSGESEICRFATADTVLTNLYLIDRWVTDLSDIYEKAA